MNIESTLSQAGIDKASLIQKLDNGYSGSYEYQKRRHEEWKENYILNRNKVIINRVTQRQTVVIPLMKATKKSILANIDDMPVMNFESKSNNEDVANFLRYYFEENIKRELMINKDRMAKNEEFLYGRSHFLIYPKNGYLAFKVLDVYDFLVDQFVSPESVQTTNYSCLQHVYVRMEDLYDKEKYDQEAVYRLAGYYTTNKGIQVMQSNSESLNDKNMRLQAIGFSNITNPEVAGAYIEVRHHFINLWDKNAKETVRWVVTTATGNNVEILAMNKCEDVFGTKKIPVEGFASDIENTDYWSDGAGDDVRPSNMNINVLYSQMMENRTLINYSMKYFDTSVSGKEFKPQKWTPRPWGWYPVNGDPNKIIKDVQIPPLEQVLNEIRFIIDMSDKTAGSSVIKGEINQARVTLGEVEIAQRNAMERLSATEKLYRNMYQRLIEMYVEMVMGLKSKLKGYDLSVKAPNDMWYTGHVKPSMFKEVKGFHIEVTSSTEQEANRLETLKRMQVISQYLPQNKAYIEIRNRRALDLVDFSPDEIKRIVEEEKQKMKTPPEMPQGQGGQGMPQEAVTPPAEIPELPALT